jgi:hypothetical protein
MDGEGTAGQASFRVGVEDLAAAYRVQMMGPLSSWRGAALTGVAIGIVGMVLYALGQRGFLELWLPLLCGVLAWPAVRWLVGRVSIPRLARRIHAQQRNLWEEVEASWDERGLRLRTGSGEVRTPWADYRRWREDEEVVLLFHSDLLFQILPKRALEAEAVAGLRQLAAAARVPGAN